MRLLIWSIAAPYCGSLIDEFAGLNIPRAFYPRGGAPLTMRASLITLPQVSENLHIQVQEVELTLRCLFLQRSHALLDGTPGIVGCVPVSRFPGLNAQFSRSWEKLCVASL